MFATGVDDSFDKAGTDTVTEAVDAEVILDYTKETIKPSSCYN